MLRAIVMRWRLAASASTTYWSGLARLALRPGSDTCLPPGVPTLAEAMREAGYWTIGVASNQFLYEPSGFSRGFDDWVQVDDRPPVAGKASRQRLKNAHESRTWHSVIRVAVSAQEPISGDTSGVGSLGRDARQANSCMPHFSMHSRSSLL